MADGGGSSSGAGAAAGAGASAAAASSEAASETSKASSKTAVAEADAKEGEQSKEKGSEVIADKAVTVQEVKEKTTIDKDHVEGEEKKEPVKHKYADRLAKAYPGKQFSSDQEYEDAHEDYVKDLEGYKERGTIANQKLVALFEAEPQIADVITSMIAGDTMRSALARHIGAEDLVPEEGDPDYAKWDENNKQRLARIENTNKFNQEFNDNLEFSRQSVEAFAEENNLKPEEAEKILTEFDDMLKDIFRGKITKETLAKIVRAVKHDEAVKEAKEEGIIAGKNEAVKAVVEKETPKTDGIPVVGKTGDVQEVEEEEKVPDEVSIINRIFEAGAKRNKF